MSEDSWNYANGIDFSKVESFVPANKGYGNSTTISFDVTDAPTDITTELYEAASRLFDRLWDKKRAIRHLGVHTAHVKSDSGFRQMSMFESRDFEKLKRLDRAVDLIRSRYGKESVMRSVFLINPAVDPMIGGISKEKRGIHQND